MSETARSAEVIDPDVARKCKVHGLLFDPDIAETCPLCEYERTDRIAGTHR